MAVADVTSGIMSPCLHEHHEPEARIVLESKVQHWQLIGIPRPISSYCFYKDICPSPKLYPNLLQMTILHLYRRRRRRRRSKIKIGRKRRVEMIPSDKRTAKGGLQVLMYVP